MLAQYTPSQEKNANSQLLAKEPQTFSTGNW
jgi:hypothetical protein